MTIQPTCSSEEMVDYMAECTLATVQEYTMRKRKPIGEYRRQQMIAQSALNWLKYHGVEKLTSRVQEVKDDFNWSVEAWAKAEEEKW